MASSSTPYADYSYGAGGPDQFCRVHLPNPLPSASVPVILVVHGGYWKKKWNISNAAHMTIAPSFAETGRFLAVEMEYPETLDDAAACLAALPALAKDHGWPGDFSRLVVIGHSAGGQIALWLADHAAVSSTSSSTMPVPRLVVALAPVTDMVAAYERKLSDEGDAAEMFMKCCPSGGGDDDDASGDAMQKYCAASPMHRLPLKVPTILGCGAGDADVPMDMVVSYHDAAKAVGGASVELVTFDPEVDHYEPMNAASPEWAKVRAAMDGAMARW
jgi:acetyl esterase/lipase